MSERHHWMVDSIEESIASIEVDGDLVVTVPKWLLPRAAREGDVLSVAHAHSGDGADSTLRIKIDRDETARRIEASRRQVSGGRSPNDPGGDIVL